jgi:Uncharacterised ACR, YagE family COG1723
VFVIRHDVNLHTEILDTPDFFWYDGQQYEGDYKMVSETKLPVLDPEHSQTSAHAPAHTTNDMIPSFCYTHFGNHKTQIYQAFLFYSDL